MKKGKRWLCGVLALAVMLSTVTAAFGQWQAVNPQWSESKQQVKKPAWSVTEEEIAAAVAAGAPAGYPLLYVGHGEDSLYGADWNLSEQGAPWGYGTGTAQFQLLHSESGAICTGYCADIDTTSKPLWWYKVENLETADYYGTEEAADHIRAIVSAGYWGTAEGTGSLAAMKEMLCAAVETGTDTDLTKEQVQSLTEGEALTATQIAVWKYGNPYEVITLGASTLDVGSPYWDYCDGVLREQYGMTEADIDDALMRIDAVARYLMTLTMPRESAGETALPHDGAAVENASLRSEGLLYADETGRLRCRASLHFTPLSPLQPGDELTVQVRDAAGAVLAEGRIAPSETDGVLFPDRDGGYTLTGLTVPSEEKVTVHITVSGQQQVSRGVYVYTSEERQGVCSQTFVGLAEGMTAVEGAQTLTLALEDPLYSGGYSGGGGEASVVEAPPTGDGIVLWSALASVGGLGLCLCPLKKRKK